MPKDPVCGMSVAEDSPHRAEHLGRTYYFCSAHCAQAFDSDPVSYLDKDQVGSVETLRSHREHASEGRLGVHESAPAECSSCATPAESADLARKRADMEYTCPMHPEVRQPAPGTCPKCGMALEPLGQAPAPVGIEYVCPMHPEVVRDRPGTCPKCGMAL